MRRLEEGGDREGKKAGTRRKKKGVVRRRGMKREKSEKRERGTDDGHEKD
jgi:hypothetical protein